MCRMVVFAGTCPQCGGEFTWEELSQELSCLEAKNVGVFGQCRLGVAPEYHTFDQDCPTCAAVLEEDEGVDVFDPPVLDESTQGYHQGGGHEYPAAATHQSKHGGGGKDKGKGRADDDGGRRKKKQRTG